MKTKYFIIGWFTVFSLFPNQSFLYSQNSFERKIKIKDSKSTFKVEAISETSKPLSLKISYSENSDTIEFSNSPIDVFQLDFLNSIKKLGEEKSPPEKFSSPEQEQDIRTEATLFYTELKLFESKQKEVVPTAGYITVFRDIEINQFNDSIPCLKKNKKEKLKKLIGRNKECIDKLKKIVDDDNVPQEFIHLRDELESMKSTQTKELEDVKTFSNKELKEKIIQSYSLNIKLNSQIKDAPLIINEYLRLKKNEEDLKKISTDLDNNYQRVRKSLVESLNAITENTGTLKNCAEYVAYIQDPTTIKDKFNAYSTYLNSMTVLPSYPDFKDITDTIKSLDQFVKIFSSQFESFLNSTNDQTQNDENRKTELLQLMADIQKNISQMPAQVSSDDSIRKSVLESQLSGFSKEWVLKDNSVKLAKKISERLSDFMINSIKNDLQVKIDEFKKIIPQLKVKYQQIDKAQKALDDQKRIFMNMQKIPMFKLKTLQLKFEMGTLYNIEAIGMYKGTEVCFNRDSDPPIPFYSISNYNKFEKFDLKQQNNKQNVIKLSQLIRYSPQYQNNSDDYAPFDTTYHIFIESDSVKVIQTYKERASQIFEAKAFTDIIGFSSDQPNGLIQFEVSKRIPINAIGKRGFTLLRYYFPSVTLSKIEQNNKYYIIQTTDDNSGKGEISTLDIFKYSSWRFKLVNLNLIYISMIEQKTAIELNGGFSLFYTPIKDTINNTQWGAVSGMPFGELRIVIKPDPRYGFTLSGSCGWLYLWNDKMIQINDPSKPYDASSYNRKLINFQFDTFYKPFKSNQNSIFIRLSNVHTIPFTQTYLQFQVGYSFNVLNHSVSR